MHHTCEVWAVKPAQLCGAVMHAQDEAGFAEERSAVAGDEKACLPAGTVLG